MLCTQPDIGFVMFCVVLFPMTKYDILQEHANVRKCFMQLMKSSYTSDCLLHETAPDEWQMHEYIRNKCVLTISLSFR